MNIKKYKKSMKKHFFLQNSIFLSISKTTFEKDWTTKKNFSKAFLTSSRAFAVSSLRKIQKLILRNRTRSKKILVFAKAH
jgi:hypothetical protein